MVDALHRPAARPLELEASSFGRAQPHANSRFLVGRSIACRNVSFPTAVSAGFSLSLIAHRFHGPAVELDLQADQFVGDGTQLT
jgi:hypothetical protein